MRAPGPVGEGAPDAVGEGGDLDHRTTEGGREQRGERRDVGRRRLDVRGDRVDPDQLGVGRGHRRGDLAEQRDGLVGDALDHAPGLVQHAAELDQRDRQSPHQQHERHGRDESRDASDRHAPTLSRSCSRSTETYDESRRPIEAPNVSVEGVHRPR